MVRMIVEVMSVGRECGALAERFAIHLRPDPLVTHRCHCYELVQDFDPSGV
jgi:hypothetical protein